MLLPQHFVAHIERQSVLQRHEARERHRRIICGLHHIVARKGGGIGAVGIIIPYQWMPPIGLPGYARVGRRGEERLLNGDMPQGGGIAIPVAAGPVFDLGTDFAARHDRMEAGRQ